MRTDVRSVALAAAFVSSVHTSVFGRVGMALRAVRCGRSGCGYAPAVTHVPTRLAVTVFGTIAAAVQAGISGVKRMSVVAVRSRAVCIRARIHEFAAPIVFNGRDWLKVERINARANTAQVVRHESVWEWADQVFIRSAMRQRGAAKPEDSVTASVSVCRPSPTGAKRFASVRWIDALKLGFESRPLLWRHRVIFS